MGCDVATCLDVPRSSSQAMSALDGPLAADTALWLASPPNIGQAVAGDRAGAVEPDSGDAPTRATQAASSAKTAETAVRDRRPIPTPRWTSRPSVAQRHAAHTVQASSRSPLRPRGYGFGVFLSSPRGVEEVE